VDAVRCGSLSPPPNEQGEHEQCTDHLDCQRDLMAIKTRKDHCKQAHRHAARFGYLWIKRTEQQWLNSTSSNANVWMLAIAVISILVRLMPTIAQTGCYIPVAQIRRRAKKQDPQAKSQGHNVPMAVSRSLSRSPRIPMPMAPRW